MLDAENPADNNAADSETADNTTADNTTADNTAAEGTTSSDSTDTTASVAAAAVSNPPGESPAADAETPPADRPAKKTAAKRTTKKTAAVTKKAAAKRATKKTAAADEAAPDQPAPDQPAPDQAEADQAEADQATSAPAERRAAKKATAKKTARKTAAKKTSAAVEDSAAGEDKEPADQGGSQEPAPKPATEPAGEPAQEPRAGATATALLFQAPDTSQAASRRRKPAQREADAEAGDQQGKAEPSRGRKSARSDKDKDRDREQPEEEPTEDTQGRGDDADSEEGDGERSGRRRRRRGGRRRRKGGEDEGSEDTESKSEEAGGESPGKEPESGDGTSGTRRRRRRRRAGEESDGSPDDPKNTVTRIRKARSAEDEITSVTGSTRLEAKKQRRREGREAGRRRAPIVSEAEFLARREAVDRVMVIRQRKDLTQIAVLEDKVLVEHYVARESQTSLIGNVYLGRVQNVLPSMEAAFIDIGKGRNAVLYAGEVNWGALGAKDGGQRRIEQVLKSGQSVLVQVTKDPIGHKGARLTSQVSLPGRFLVYVPDGTTSGISRKLPDTERNRLKTLLKEIVPDTAGVIVRTAAEGASEQELTRDVERLTARWGDIQAKVKAGNAPQLLYGEPDLTLKVVRDLFTEDFGKLVVSGEDAWEMVDGYVQHVAPDLADRLERYDGGGDVFAAYRIDEQIAKALDRKVWLPSGGSLIIDRTEAMTVIDVNTGKFTGSGGNLEETVTKNNLEAAEEIVRQLRLRDIGGIIVVDFIDMVLESNRDLVLRRMVECLGRDRTRHQVAEVTSLGLVQMTRKRIGTGLLEAFSESCEHCQGRGLIVHHEPVEPKKKQEEEPRRGRRGGRGRAKGGEGSGGDGAAPSPKEIAAMAKPEQAPAESDGEADDKATADKATVGKATDGKATDDQPADDRAADAAAVTAAEGGTADEGDTAAEGVTAPEAESKAEGRSRRRGRAKKAVTPAEPAADETVASEASLPGEAVAEAPSTEPVAEDVTTEPAAPRIVTSVRRRGVRRPAGPPSGLAADGEVTDAPGAGNGASPDGTSSDDADDSHPLEATAHVPVKKKGSRSR